MIFTLLYYMVFSSAVLIYGIGMNNATILCESYKSLTVSFLKMILSILFTCALTMLIIKQFLITLGIIEIYPLIAILIFMTVSILLEIIFRILTGKVSSDFNFSFLIILLTLNESLTYTDILFTALGSFISFVILLPLLNSIKVRIRGSDNEAKHANVKSLLLVGISILILVIYAANVSWLNPGVIK